MRRFHVVRQERQARLLELRPVKSHAPERWPDGWRLDVCFPDGECVPIMHCISRDAALEYAMDRARRLGIEVRA